MTHAPSIKRPHPETADPDAAAADLNAEDAHLHEAAADLNAEDAHLHEAAADLNAEDAHLHEAAADLNAEDAHLHEAADVMPRGAAYLEQDPAACHPEAFSAADVFDILRTICRATRRIPVVRLAPEERMALSGYAFIEGADLIYETADALSREPEIFRDIPIRPEDLIGRQQRAAALTAISALFRELSDWTGDLALHDQAGAVRDCFDVLERVRSDAGAPFPTRFAVRRRRAMVLPEKVLDDRQKQKIRTARHRDLKDRKAVAEAGGQPLSPSPRKPGGPSAIARIRSRRDADGLLSRWSAFLSAANRAGAARSVQDVRAGTQPAPLVPGCAAPDRGQTILHGHESPDRQPGTGSAGSGPDTALSRRDGGSDCGTGRDPAADRDAAGGG